MRWTTLVCSLIVIGCGGRTAPFVDEAPVADASVPATPTADVAAGSTHACLRDLGGDVFCWGAIWLGRTDGTAGSLPVPVDLGHPPAVAISCAARYCCGLSDRGEVRCWGDSVPESVVYRDESSILALAAGEESLCLLTGERAVVCYGSYRDRAEPRVWVASSADEVAASRGSYGTMTIGFACAVVGGSVLCFGSNDAGQLGRPPGSTGPDDLVTVEGVTGVTDLALGSRHACAVTASGEVFCWGSNAALQLGAPGPGGPTPVRVPALPPDIVRVESGHDNTCAVRADGQLTCWGDNDFGQLGGTPGEPRGPTPIDLPSPVVDVAVGELFICAVDTANDVWCWGRNHRGQLGDGTFISRSAPARVTL